ncbi:MAG: hypothetical protein A3F78_12295 [Burkholderiales bacterium RIFCSPLOWO2_12_FULL_61_40]|nr:MAG: hypothetical protein A3F78_12295 [Burkholderiales bacterium RIFCSPLOWO2_12_FULL_61_40]
MKTLLRIDTSIRTDGSHTRVLADYFAARWLEDHPDGRVVRRCLASDPVPHLSNAMFEAFQQGRGQSPDCALSDDLIDELKGADHVLIGSPLYNLTLPSTLKAYFDHVVRADATFEVRAGNYRGLLDGRGATLIAARGGLASPECADDFQTAYLKAILAFIGIGPVALVAVAGTALGGEAKEQALADARQQVDRLFGKAQAPLWHGEFSADDKRQIGALRDGQAAAIVSGDARAYAELCADDIQLLIPNRDAICGQAGFLAAEEALFRSAVFAAFRKQPLRVERSGSLAVETGRQEVVMAKQDAAGGVFSARQKYTHVFRLTEKGWRFAVLMSNPSE